MLGAGGIGDLKTDKDSVVEGAFWRYFVLFGGNMDIIVAYRDLQIFGV